MPIMYVCEICQEHSPETCGHERREEIRVAPDGQWVCDGCWECSREENEPRWLSLPIPPEYVPAELALTAALSECHP